MANDRCGSGLESCEVEVLVEHGEKSALRCQECDEASGYDTRCRSWRHLPTCQYKAILTADVPRVRCRKHDVKTLGVRSAIRLHRVVEAVIIDWLSEASIQAVARRLDLTRDQVDGVTPR